MRVVAAAHQAHGAALAAARVGVAQRVGAGQAQQRFDLRQQRVVGGASWAAARSSTPVRAAPPCAAASLPNGTQLAKGTAAISARSARAPPSAASPAARPWPAATTAARPSGS